MALSLIVYRVECKGTDSGKAACKRRKVRGKRLEARIAAKPHTHADNL